MINREDLVFATCYQLAQIISSDWEPQSEEVKMALEALTPIDEPGETLWGTSVNGQNPLKLHPYETEPEGFRTTRKVFESKMVIIILSLIMKHSDGWETNDSDIIKKEILARIANYEADIKKLTAPNIATCNIVA